MITDVANGRARAGWTAALLLILAAYFAFTLINTSNFTYDDSWYAENAIRFLDAMCTGGFPAAYDFFIHRAMGGVKAPLIIVLCQPMLLAVGRHDFAFLLTNLIGLAVATFYLRALARIFLPEWAASSAAAIFCLMPLTADMARQLFVEIWLTALAIAIVYHGLKSDAFTNAAHALAAGLIAGLGLLMKVTFPVYVGGVALILIFGALRRHGDFFALGRATALTIIAPALVIGGARSDRLTLGLVCGVILAISGPLYDWVRGVRWRAAYAAALGLALWIPLHWYIVNGAAIWVYMKSASIGEISKDYGSAEILSIRAMLDFWNTNLNAGLGFVFGAAFVVTVIFVPILLFVAPRSPESAASARRAVWIALAWLLPSVLLFTLVRNRTTRFLLPVFPAFALLQLSLLQLIALRIRALSLLLLAAQLAAAAFAFAIFSFGGPRFAFGPGGRLVAWGPDLTIRGVARRSPRYPLDDIVAATRQICPIPANRPAIAMMLSDTIRINQNTLSYAAARLGTRMQYGLIPYNTDCDAATTNALNSSDVLLVQDGGNDFPDFTNRCASEARRRIDTGAITGWKRLDSPTVTLPDGGLIHFYIRDSATTDGV